MRVNASRSFQVVSPLLPATEQSSDVYFSVVIMSHPFKGSPTLPFNTVSNPQPAKKEDVQQALASLPQPRKHYKWYYSTASAASEMDNPKEGLHEFLRGYFHLKSADWKGNNPKPLEAWDANSLAKLPYYYVMPLGSGMRESVRIAMSNEDPEEVSKMSSRWLPDEDLKVYVEAWKCNGFQGGLNWYRVATDPSKMIDVELFAGRKIDIPLLYIAGKQDWGSYQEPGALENMDKVCSKLKGIHLVDGAGHWVQQEQPEKVIELVSNFLKQVKVDSVSY